MTNLKLSCLCWSPAVAILVMVAPALAHRPSESYLELKLADGKVSGRWDIALRDLQLVLGLDADRNGEVTWGEIRERFAEIDRLALEGLALGRAERSCSLTIGDHLVDRRSDGGYMVLRLNGNCGGEAEHALRIRYTLFAGVDDYHRGILNLGVGSHPPVLLVLDPRNPERVIDGTPQAAGLGDFFYHGVVHIWLGFDHLLFLTSLLLPAVMSRRGWSWTPVVSFRGAFLRISAVVTAFTVAHSLTLSAAVLGLADIPSRLVESIIAFSVAVAALNNLVPLYEERRAWLVAFLFGLVHGFGFASALGELHIPDRQIALPLLGFNLGVEAGQLAVLCILLPVVFALRQTAVYRRIILTGGSAAIVVISLLWLGERALNVTLMSRDLLSSYFFAPSERNEKYTALANIPPASGAPQ